MTETEDRLAPTARGEARVRPVEPQPLAGTWTETEEDPAEDRSLLEDLHALYDDGKTYASAELNFQKSRASFAAGKGKSVAIFGGAAAVAALLALIGLTVGAILSLATLIGPLGATAVVVIVLLIVAFLCLRVAGKAWGQIAGAFSSGGQQL